MALTAHERSEKSGGFRRNTASQDVTDVGVVFGDQLLLQPLQLHLHLLLRHGADRKRLHLLQEVLDQTFSGLTED